MRLRANDGEVVPSPVMRPFYHLFVSLNFSRITFSLLFTLTTFSCLSTCSFTLRANVSLPKIPAPVAELHFSVTPRSPFVRTFELEVNVTVPRSPFPHADAGGD